MQIKRTIESLNKDKKNSHFLLLGQRSNDNLSFAPNDFQFNFVPKTQSNQRIFDSDIPEATRELSAITLTKRYQNRIKKQFNIHQWVAPQSSPNRYESALVKHQNVAYTLVIYFQALFNIMLSLTMLYVFIQIILIIRHDFNIKVDEQLKGKTHILNMNIG